MKLGVITNPNSRKNRRHPDRVAALEQLVGRDGIVRRTGSLEELRPALQDLVAAQTEYWISDGGDGSFHWMLNVGQEVLDARGREGDANAAVPTMVPTNGGTVDFVARKAGLSGDADDILRWLVGRLHDGAAPATISLDSLELRGRRPGDPEGELSVHRLGFGIAIGGVGQRFFSHYYDQTIQGPKGIALLAAKASVGFYTNLPLLERLPLAPGGWRRIGADLLRGTEARVVADGREFSYGRFHGLHAGSFHVDVGAIELFPYADAPGKLHFVVGTISPSEALPGLIDLVRGRPARGKRWHEMAGERLEVWATGDEPLAPFIDGERLPELEYLCLTPGPAVEVPTPQWD